MIYVAVALGALGLVWGLIYLIRRAADGRYTAQAQGGADGYTPDSGSYATPFWTSGSDSAGTGPDVGAGRNVCDTGSGSDSGGWDSGGSPDSASCDSGGGDSGGGGGGGD